MKKLIMKKMKTINKIIRNEETHNEENEEMKKIIGKQRKS